MGPLCTLPPAPRLSWRSQWESCPATSLGIGGWLQPGEEQGECLWLVLHWLGGLNLRVCMGCRRTCSAFCSLSSCCLGCHRFLEIQSGLVPMPALPMLHNHLTMGFPIVAFAGHVAGSSSTCHLTFPRIISWSACDFPLWRPLQLSATVQDLGSSLWWEGLCLGLVASSPFPWQAWEEAVPLGRPRWPP